tara:strand:+ start:571 stop:735 length:165 start_codon:yes stop_codon:yes gene_type:complete
MDIVMDIYVVKTWTDKDKDTEIVIDTDVAIDTDIETDLDTDRDNLSFVKKYRYN